MNISLPICMRKKGKLSLDNTMKNGLLNTKTKRFINYFHID